MKVNSPCLNCTERTVEPNCHSTCEKYLEYMNRSQEYKEAMRQAKLSKGGAYWSAICHSHNAKIGNNHKK